MNQLYWGNIPTTLESVLSCVGPGWHKLVTQLCEDLFAQGWDGQLFQVKEKFGGLRFYTVGDYSRECEDLIIAAEKLSVKTCEECGAPGEQVVIKNWMFTRCDKHK